MHSPALCGNHPRVLICFPEPLCAPSHHVLLVLDELHSTDRTHSAADGSELTSSLRWMIPPGLLDFCPTSAHCRYPSTHGGQFAGRRQASSLHNSTGGVSYGAAGGGELAPRPYADQRNADAIMSCVAGLTTSPAAGAASPKPSPHAGEARLQGSPLCLSLSLSLLLCTSLPPLSPLPLAHAQPREIAEKN